MSENETIPSNNPPRPQPWNKGKLIRTKLQLETRTRDLSLFNLAIDSKLRGCDVVAIRVDDVFPPRLHARSSNGPPEEDRSSGPV